MRLLAFALVLAASGRAEIVTERIFGPETRTGPYKHPASICALDNGDLLLVYYGGEGEYARSTAVYLSRLRPGNMRWSDPRPVARDPFRSTGNGVCWQDPRGRVWLFYVIRFGDTWSTSRIAAKVSDDRGETWSDPSLLSLEEGWMVRGKPILLSSGKWLLPIYHEVGSDRERVEPETSSLFLLHDPATGRWTPGGKIRSRNGNLQPAPVELAPGHLLAFCRRGGGYTPEERGFIIASESFDEGMNWTEGRDTEWPNPNSAVELIRLRSGKLLLICNPVHHGRTPLTAALSEDGGRTWPWRRNLAEGKDSFAYPSAVQTADGRIHVVYTSDERRAIRRAIFREEDVMRGEQQN
ncbi:MAG: glycosyl hydrolase [Bryobacteraceae bacterium]|nr:MAG: glycosyl hydrolase [Bryobacteraceae bacterium]